VEADKKSTELSVSSHDAESPTEVIPDDAPDVHDLELSNDISIQHNG